MTPGWWLVTGGAGFIGSHLVDALAARGERVRVLDDFSLGKRENLAHHGKRVEVQEGSVTDPEALRAALAGVEVVLHQAAIPSVARSVREPARSLAVNAGGSLAVLEAARLAGARRVVLASSSSVYGDTPSLPKREDEPWRPLSPYAASKAALEAYARLYFRLHGLETVCLRYFNVFGPRQDPRAEYAAAVPAFLSRSLAGQPAEIHGDGGQTRDFTYVANVVEANLLAARAPRAAGGVCNVGAGGRVSIRELARLAAAAAGGAPAPVFGPPRPGDVRDSQADIARARELLGYEPRVGLAEGLRLTAEWLRGARK